MSAIIPPARFPVSQPKPSPKTVDSALIAKAMKELSLLTVAGGDRVLLAQFLKDPANVSALVREAGLLNFLIEAVSENGHEPESLSALQKLKPQLIDIIPSKILAAASYEFGIDTRVTKEPEDNSPNSNFIFAQKSRDPVMNMAVPFTPSTFDYERTIDDLNATDVDTISLGTKAAQHHFQPLNVPQAAQSWSLVSNLLLSGLGVALILYLLSRIL